MDLHSSFLFAPAGEKTPGRVNLNTNTASGPQVPAFIFQHKVTPDTGAEADLTRGNWEQNALSHAYFSVANMSRVQHMIRRAVYERSGERRWEIDDQSIDELKIIMRAMYLQYARNSLSESVESQVAELNSIVLEWCVPRIMSEITSYMMYLNDITAMPVPMAHPVSMSSAGTKSGTFNRFF
jgi:hypothetical protein